MENIEALVRLLARQAAREVFAAPEVQKETGTNDQAE